ncbi:hypothetical protein H257_04068 [Aphanomyces astaci]|uniref:WRKY19-like zinc finger domain-containing protein n=1 Tax=Aphanomyces astaci TaxID=112090 RepID=W4GWL7_APHAT|nr:hypothetical protein H257_04068 [Aphanomyces astaci]ETV83313.1 hypothetical protein H257_04068 [Aphanomyces astaci]|eukprot:XP_009826743.1 hypothetical protein H257_04068 [Aphanomyces astaci]
MFGSRTTATVAIVSLDTFQHESEYLDNFVGGNYFEAPVTLSVDSLPLLLDQRYDHGVVVRTDTVSTILDSIPCALWGHPFVWTNDALAYDSTDALVASIDLADISCLLPELTNTCGEDGCHQHIQFARGYCRLHGGKKLCSELRCAKRPQRGGRCYNHGGGTRCIAHGCTKGAQARSLCKAHGGKIKCSESGCQKTSQGHGLCRSHGGGKRCIFPHCEKGVQQGYYCTPHIPKSQNKRS